MCVEVLVIRPDGEHVWCSNVGELASAIETVSEAFCDLADDTCLCPVDLVALGARAPTEDEDNGPWGSQVIDLTTPRTQEAG